MHGIVAKTTTPHRTSEFVQRNHDKETHGCAGNVSNRMSSNPSLDVNRENTNHVRNSGNGDSLSPSLNGPAREFLRKERRKRLF